MLLFTAEEEIASEGKVDGDMSADMYTYTYGASQELVVSRITGLEPLARYSQRMVEAAAAARASASAAQFEMNSNTLSGVWTLAADLIPEGLISIVETALATPALSTFAELLTSPDYSDVLEVFSGRGQFTVFAPTDEAFVKAGINVSDVESVIAVLKYHVLTGFLHSNTAPSLAVLRRALKWETLQGEELSVSKEVDFNTYGGYFVNSGQQWSSRSEVVLADVMVSNGVVHVVDKVLIPPSWSDARVAELRMLQPPSLAPSSPPTPPPTLAPSTPPTPPPTLAPSPSPTLAPTLEPSELPTPLPPLRALVSNYSLVPLFSYVTKSMCEC
jgi:uncharacterized surface protein with fasciclin (FAS1) repeats